MADRVIFHCDLNCFFASVELLDKPALREVPVAVCGDPASRHGIILAKNEPAKRRGIQTAETVWQAKQKCPNLILLPPHHGLYAQYSRRINTIYGQYTDLVEPFGIDESWLDVTGSLHLFGDDARQLADDIRARLRQEVQARRESQAGAVLRLQAEEGRIRQVYPDFDWRREMASPRFGRLVTAGVDGRTAYEIVHRQELLKAAMGYAAAQARSQMARSIASGGGRAAENRGDSRSVTRSDPRGLTSRELADIRKRVQDGEKIRF